MIQLRVPGDLAYRHLAMRVVTTACKMAFDGDDPDESEAQTISAFGEAFNNVAIHAYRDRPRGDVQIDISWTAEQLVIYITDDGQTFDPGLVDLPDLDELPEGKMGLFIMRSFMDEVDYRPGPPNVLRMIKRRPRSSGTVLSPPPSAVGLEVGSSTHDWGRAVNDEGAEERASGGARRS